MANKYTKRCLMPLVIKEMQTEATAKHHSIPTRISRTQESNKCGEDVEKSEPPYIAGRNVK